MDQELQTSNSIKEVSTFFDGNRLNQMTQMAKAFYDSGCFGSDVQNAHQALVKIQTGLEMGMPPMEAMNSLYILKGKVTIWGAAMTKRLRDRGWKITYGTCNKDEANVTITKGDEEYSFEIKKEDMPKSTAMGFAPIDKLKYHAISRLIRFNVPEVLGAGVSYLKEEMEDMPEDTQEINTDDFKPVKEEKTEVKPKKEKKAPVKEKAIKEEKAEEVIEEANIVEDEEKDVVEDEEQVKADIKSESNAKEEEPKEKVTLDEATLNSTIKAICECKTEDELKIMQAKFEKKADTLAEESLDVIIESFKDHVATLRMKASPSVTKMTVDSIIEGMETSDKTFIAALGTLHKETVESFSKADQIKIQKAIETRELVLDFL